MNFHFGYGKWDSWGLGISYLHYDRLLSIDFIHWYAYIQVWKKHN